MKKIFITLLILLLSFSVALVLASCKDNTDDDNIDNEENGNGGGSSSIYSEGLAYELSEDGTYYIVSGIGTCTDTDVVIPSVYNNLPVKEIYGFAFMRCSNLTSVKIGNNVTHIGDFAFYGCDSLTSVIIPDSVTHIGDGAFYECDSLTSITVDENNKNYKSIDKNLYSKDGKTLIQYAIGKTDKEFIIPADVTHIGDSAFSVCDNLTSVTIGNSVTHIDVQAFSLCSNLTSVTIGNGVTHIGDFAFWWCDSLTSFTVDENNETYKSVDGNLYSKDGKTLIQYATGKADTKFIIPDDVTHIGNSAFYLCDSLTSVTIGNSVTHIGESAFESCISLTSITVGENNANYKSINGNLYSKDGKTLIQYAIGKADKEFIIPDDVTHIGDWAFSYCSSLTSVIIPDSVTHIGVQAFSDCDSLSSIVIPDSITHIGNTVFYGCDNLASIVIPNSVTYIAYSAFDYCSSFTKVYYLGTSEEWDSIDEIGYKISPARATIYFYSENKPAESGNFWHYDADGNIALW